MADVLTSGKALYFAAMAAVGQDRRMLRSLRGTSALTILNLHDIGVSANPYAEPLHPDLFRALLRFLVRRCDVLTFGELHSWRPTGRPAVLLSFDDGLRSFAEYAVPMLEAVRCRANQNVIVGCLESGTPPWEYRIPAVLWHDPAAAGRLGRALDVEVGSLSPRRLAVALTTALKKLGREGRTDVLASANIDLDEDIGDVPATLTAAEVVELAGFHEIGAHSCGHDTMAYESAEFFSEDVARCGLWFEQQGLPMSIYAFPNGSHTRTQVEHLHSSGVEHVLLVGERRSLIEASTHPRFTVYGNTAAEVRLRALGHRPHI
jgi:peptidoglycan/xylan/chitin deacetylase (PgdA/CDA1 family)